MRLPHNVTSYPRRLEQYSFENSTRLVLVRTCSTLSVPDTHGKVILSTRLASSSPRGLTRNKVNLFCHKSTRLFISDLAAARSTVSSPTSESSAPFSALRTTCKPVPLCMRKRRSCSATPRLVAGSLWTPQSGSSRHQIRFRRVYDGNFGWRTNSFRDSSPRPRTYHETREIVLNIRPENVLLHLIEASRIRPFGGNMDQLHAFYLSTHLNTLVRGRNA